MNQYKRYRSKATFYNGRWYRSNMEARVAEELDKHNMIWEYEPCCFRDSRFEYGQYTPDFRILNNSGTALCYIEVCGEYDYFHKNKCETLARIIDEQNIQGNVVVVSNTLFAAIKSVGGRINAHEIDNSQIGFLSKVLYVQ